MSKIKKMKDKVKCRKHLPSYLTVTKVVKDKKNSYNRKQFKNEWKNEV